LARLLAVDELVDLTYDGCVSRGVLEALERAPAAADVVTLTVGGNDLLSGYFFRPAGDRGAKIALGDVLENLEAIADRLARFACPVVMNTVYDPTDGDDAKAEELGLPVEARQALDLLNGHIASVAGRHGFLLCDLEARFRGHGNWSAEPWVVKMIEPNHAGATQIAQAWHALLRERNPVHHPK
jgi:hypothetical protein